MRKEYTIIFIEEGREEIKWVLSQEQIEDPMLLVDLLSGILETVNQGKIVTSHITPYYN